MFNLVPKWPVVAGALVVGLAGGVIGMHVWDKGEIAALNLSLAQIKQKQAEDVATASQAALKNLADATKIIKDAASEGQVSVSALGVKLDTLNRSFKNAKPAPLPVDCRPGAVRVRNLTESAAAVDQAIARSIPGK